MKPAILGTSVALALIAAAIEEATSAMNEMSDAGAKGLVHTFIDDAKMLLGGAKHNHAKPAAVVLASE